MLQADPNVRPNIHLRWSIGTTRAPRRAAGVLVREHGDRAAQRAAGKDYFTETREAVRAVQKVRPDMTASAALRAVEAVRRRL